MRKETEESRRGKEAKAAVEPRVPSFRVEGVFMCAESGPGVSVSSVRFSFFFFLFLVQKEVRTKETIERNGEFGALWSDCGGTIKKKKKNRTQDGKQI